MNNEEVELQQTKLFDNHAPEEFPVITVGLRDKGESNAVIPVLKELNAKVHLYVFADGKAEDSLRETMPGQFSETREDPLLRVADLSAKSDVVFSGLAANSGAELALEANAILNGVPVVWVEDVAGIWTDIIFNQRGFPTHLDGGKSFIPDLFCVINDWARAREIAQAPESLRKELGRRILVTGHPAHDRIFRENLPAIRAEVRNKLCLTDENLIVYAGTIEKEETTPSAEMIRDAAKKLTSPYKLIFRPHPANVELIAACNKIFEELGDNFIADIRNIPNDSIYAACDLLISNLSTVSEDAGVRGIPSINISVTEHFKNMEVSGIAFGLAPRATNLAEFTDVFNKILLDKDYLNDLKKRLKDYRTTQKIDGKAAERVAQEVLKQAARVL